MIIMEANEIQVVADLIDQMQRLHGYMTARRSADCWYFEDPQADGYVTEYPILPDSLAHYDKYLTLIYGSRHGDWPLLMYTGKQPPQELCLHFGWRSVEVVYTEEAVR